VKGSTGTPTSDLTCLHTDEDGIYWYINSKGSCEVFDKFQAVHSFRNGVYRVLGCPSNYRLITELYSRLSRQDADACVYVGSSAVCDKRRSTVEEALSCISALRVHDNLSHQWHALNSTSFNNYLLLRAYEEEGFSDLVSTVFNHHCLYRHFEFAGVPLHFAIQLISLIVDPRWFIHTNRPFRMQPLESYFGLTPTAFSKAWNARLGSKFSAATARAVFLLSAVQELDKHSFVSGEKKDGSPERQARHSCKILLSYVARNWLEALGLDGYFDHKKFFRRLSHQHEYQGRFRDT